MININNLDFKYPKQALLFDKLNLNMKNGSITGLLGKNGAGKSSLLKLIAGLLIPKDGTIEVASQTPHHRLPIFLEDIFLVPEELYFPNSISIKNYIKLLAPLYPNFNYNKADKIIEEFELDRNRKLEKMSYGQKKKFIIAFALATQAKTLILDEPTNGLDIPSKLLFKKVVASEINEDQMVIISTHQVKDIESLVDKIVIVDEGKIILNKDIYELNKNYEVTTTSSPDEYDILYKEQVPGGFKVLTADDTSDGEVDLEILFNAAINGISLS